MRDKISQVAWRTSLVYAFFAALWILFSDSLLIALVLQSGDHGPSGDLQRLGPLWRRPALLLYVMLRGQLRRAEAESDRRQLAEQELRKSEAQFRAIFRDGVGGHRSGRSPDRAMEPL